MSITPPSPRRAMAPRAFVIVLVLLLVGIASMAGPQAAGPARRSRRPGTFSPP